MKKQRKILRQRKAKKHAKGFHQVKGRLADLRLEGTGQSSDRRFHARRILPLDLLPRRIIQIENANEVLSANATVTTTTHGTSEAADLYRTRGVPRAISVNAPRTRSGAVYYDPDAPSALPGLPKGSGGRKSLAERQHDQWQRWLESQRLWETQRAMQPKG